jgi:hypothetical protein
MVAAEMFEQLHRHLSDLLLASVLGRLSVLPLLVEQVTARLLAVAGRFSALVPDDFYLPAPPVYCPQPPHDSTTPSSQVHGSSSFICFISFEETLPLAAR